MSLGYGKNVKRMKDVVMEPRSRLDSCLESKTIIFFDICGK